MEEQESHEDNLVWDSAAKLWFTQEEYDEQVKRRRESRKALGSREDTHALNIYEKGLGL